MSYSSGYRPFRGKAAYHCGLKSFDTQTNSAQAVVGQRLTDAFGNQISSSGVWKGRFAYGGPYGYQEDPDTGLRLLGHRYYDSSTGRFLTRDPIKDGRNWYSYCANNPVNGVDNDGLKIKWVVGPGTTVLDLFRVISALAMLRSTPEGERIYQELIRSDKVYTITVIDSSQSSYNRGSFFDPVSGNIRIDLADLDQLYLAEDGVWYRYTLMRVLAHELGHVFINWRTHRPEETEPRVIEEFENAIMRQFGDRRDRRGHCASPPRVARWWSQDPTNWGGTWGGGRSFLPEDANMYGGSF